MTENNNKQQENYISERLSEILGGLNHNQHRFIVAMMDHPSKKEAAEAIGIVPQTAYRWPKEVEEAVELMRLNIAVGAREMLSKSVAKAALVKVAGLDDDDPKVRQAAATEVLDRILGRPLQKQDVSVTNDSITLLISGITSDDV